MSEQAEKTRKARAKRWTEAEAREVLRERRESGLSAVAFAAQRGISVTRLSYWGERLGQRAAGDVSFVSVPLSSRHAVELEHRGVMVRLGALSVDELARLVVEIARRASGC
jgi:plasmid stability protein